ncbi:hypothetical protein Poli38472_013894 [Pythium oligandrum]|uniref:Protein kinase domain-containing protein n=1 Tax=Pythium oligandrum TaxID=41045 RepID=A0A8K1C2A1_PYTOL|nr:hypothetical protein Poli38472_013894 [Pythium oligandrum]|eukprot:TMW55132.1 hypothetical protein Poli38472_013894 [Pythium oligandrum]
MPPLPLSGSPSSLLPMAAAAGSELTSTTDAGSVEQSTSQATSHRTPPSYFARSLSNEQRQLTESNDEIAFENGVNGSLAAQLAFEEEHDRRKELERTELIQMILESISSVPMAMEKINTNERLRAALEQEMGEESAILHRLFDTTNGNEGADAYTFTGGDGIWAETTAPLNTRVNGHADGTDDKSAEDEDDDSSEYDSEYENDLAEAVNQLVMSEATLTSTMDRQMSTPIAINSTSSNRASSSPHSSVGFGVSPGAYSQDGEPAAALWPRQPHQFAFTQEEEEEEGGPPVQDEVYTELIASTGEDDDDDDEDEQSGENVERNLKEMEAAFELERQQRRVSMEFSLSNPEFEEIGSSESHLYHLNKVAAALEATEVSDEENEEEEEEDDDDDEDEDDKVREYDVMQLRIIREKNRTGFEPSEDWRPRQGNLIGGRYRVQLEIGEAVFSRTYKCQDVTTNQVVCLKILKNSKEYFDQGVDEIRILQYIAARCDVDEKHLVRLLDYFYFREHLIIVTELLRDNLYEFSKLLMERGTVNYFTPVRLKKVAIEVLEALSFLHSLGLVHCDLKPENILISNFSECRIKVIDFGSACFITDELTSYVQSRSYRAPEVILGLSYDQKIDIWSLGCVLAELWTGEVLFKNDSEQALLERIIDMIGPIPADLLRESSDLMVQFNENPSFTLDALGNGILARSGFEHVEEPSLEAAVHSPDTEFLDFLHALLQIHPRHRLSAAEALRHPWLTT